MVSGSSTTLGTAVVTGASSGIGKVYAERLASKGYSLLLVARRGDRLEALASELRERFGANIRIQVADLVNASDLEGVVKAIGDDTSVTLLINNAGTSFMGPLESATADQLTTLVNLNIVALTRLAMAVLPGFKARNHGAIVNIGSVLGFDGNPYTPIYGATKAYVQNLSLALQAELANTGVLVQLVTPAGTVSEIWDVAGFPLSNLDPSLIMSTDDCVDAAMLGLERKEMVTAPSIEDDRALQAYFDAGKALMTSAQSGKPASRYADRH